jgi:hypothetical protein
MMLNRKNIITDPTGCIDHVPWAIAEKMVKKDRDLFFQMWFTKNSEGDRRRDSAAAKKSGG